MTLNVLGTGSSVSSSNSTTALLAAAATFTGTVEDVSAYTTITVSIIGSLATAVGTLYFETSHDGVTFASIPRTITDPTMDVPHPFLVAEQYFRVRYVNGAVEQTGSFSLQTIYATGRPVTVSRTVEEGFTINADASLVRNVSNYDLDQARELITGQRAFFFFGYNPDISTAWEDVHPTGGNINWQTSAVTVSVSSTDANDTIAGTGCRQVELHGLDASGNDQDEVIDLSGVTEVDSNLTYIRVNKLHSESVGTYGGSHEGNITARVQSGDKTGAILSRMYGFEGTVDASAQYGTGEAGNGYWSVPLGKVLYITDLTVDIDAGSNKTATVVLYEREGILDSTSAPFDPRRIIWDVQNGAGEVTKTFKSHIKIKGLTDLWFRAIGSASASISVSLDFYLLDANSSGK